MITIENTEVTGWEAAIRGMRNPMNSWADSDSKQKPNRFEIGPKDLSLMKRLRDAGSEHAKYQRMIIVYCDIVAPFYWWKEYDTYKVGTVSNSCSTMHKLTAKLFEMTDFSTDGDNEADTKSILVGIISKLNHRRQRYIDGGKKDKGVWRTMVQILPCCYNQRRTVMMNYQVLRNMYFQRKSHKLDEWRDFCGWIEGLPYSELITGKEAK